MILKSFVCVLAAAALSAAAPSVYGDAARGAALFDSKSCVTCHSVNGHGATAAPDLAKQGGANLTPAALAALLWNHAPKMWGALDRAGGKVEISAQDSADLFAYFFAARYMDPPADPPRGKRTFEAKHCNECHTLSGFSSPNVTASINWAAFSDPIELARQMWNHSPAMHAELAKKNLAAPTLTPGEMNDILVYLRAQPHAQKAAPAFAPASAETGAVLFEVKECASCHTSAKALALKGGTRSVSELAAAMWNHSGTMKQNSTLRPEEMKRLVGYLWSLQFEGSGDAARGAKVFAAKGCEGCHLSGPGPKLAAQVSDAYALMGALSVHAPGMLKQLELGKKTWPTLKDAEMEDLLAYLRKGS